MLEIVLDSEISRENGDGLVCLSSFSPTKIHQAGRDSDRLII